MEDKELDSQIREEVLSRWQSIMTRWLSQGEASEKKLKGKLFSRENIEKSKGEDFDYLLWPAIIKVNTTGK